MLNTIVRTMLLHMLLVAPPGDVESPRALINRGSDLLGSGQDADGIALLKKAIALLELEVRREPRVSAHHYELGRAHFYLSALANALKEFDATLEFEPGHAPAHYYRGMTLERLGKEDQAMAELESAAKIDPDNAVYWAALGERYLDGRDAKRARQALERAVKLAPRDDASLFLIGVLDADEGRLEQSIKRMRQVIEINPEAVDAYYNAGQCSQSLGRPDDAVAYFQMAAKLAPENERTLAKLVQCNQALAQPAQREQAHERLVKLFKDGESSQTFYCRDQFVVGSLEIMAFHYFELTGDEAVRYSFQVRAKHEKEPVFKFSLGSYDAINEFAKSAGKIEKGQRYFHLDRYFPSGKHETFGFYKNEPSYDVVRSRIIEILEKGIAPDSSMVPAGNGAESSKGD